MTADDCTHEFVRYVPTLDSLKCEDCGRIVPAPAARQAELQESANINNPQPKETF